MNWLIPDRYGWFELLPANTAHLPGTPEGCKACCSGCIRPRCGGVRSRGVA